MTGLSYEVIWFKQFSHVWGSSTVAMASVVGTFLLGLGVGAWMWGAVADSVAKPVLWYGLCEFGIGLLALIIPWETDVLWRLSVDYYAGFREFPTCYAFVRVATTFVVIGPSCVLMGGTLPLIVSQFAARQDLGKATAWLYGINTLGAAAGCYLIGFHVLPEFGLFWSNVITAIANIVVGIGAILYAGVAAAQGPHTAATPEQTKVESDLPIEGRENTWPLYFVAASTGCAALMLQTVWNRQLALILGSSTYAFSAMLIVILLGMGTGSLVFRAMLRTGVDHLSFLAELMVAIMFSTVVGMQLLPLAADCAGMAIPLRSNPITNAMFCIAGSASLEFLPAMGMGIMFPCLVHLIGQTTGSAGMSVGKCYASNTIGALVGTVATTIWVLPTWGTHHATGLALLIYFCTAIILAMSSKRSVRPRVAVGLAGVICAQFCGIGDNSIQINRGTFLYGYNLKDPVQPEVLFFKEGTTSNVLIEKNGKQTLFRVNGKIDGGTGGDMSMQLGLAYLPRFLNPTATRVLVIGFGTGVTSGASLLFPVTHVTCCEIEPAIICGSSFFGDVNHKPLESPRFNAVYDDARAYIQGTSDKYDLILSEPSNPWIAGVSNLFTAEFYAIASEKLAANGIFAQWIQTYAFAPQDYAMIVRTMRDVFPHLRLIRISDGDTILCGSNESLDRGISATDGAQRLVDRSPLVEADLKLHFGTANVKALLLMRVLLDEKGMQRLVDSDGSACRNLDRDLQLEFCAARHLYEFRNKNVVFRSILGAANSKWFIEHYDRLGCSDRHVTELHDLAMLFMAAGMNRTACDLVDFGLRKHPHSVSLLADRLILAPNVNRELLDRLIAIPARHVALEANRVGVAYWQKKRYGDAAIVFDRLAKEFADSATIWTNLAINRRALGSQSLADQAQRRAFELDPARFTRGELAEFAEDTGSRQN